MLEAVATGQGSAKAGAVNATTEAPATHADGQDPRLVAGHGIGIVEGDEDAVDLVHDGEDLLAALDVTHGAPSGSP